MSGITTLVSAFRGGLKPKSVRAYLIPLDPYKEDAPDTGGRRSFQYFPETISDTKASNYQTKVIPGLSHPLYQWTSSGAREISFEAIFTRDRALSSNEKKAILGSNEALVKASSASQTTRNHEAGRQAAITGITSASALGKNTDPRNPDIPSAIAWLRSFMYPEYSQDGTGFSTEIPNRPKPPRKLILGLPGVRINWGVPVLPSSEVFCIMLSCDSNYMGFFSDGTPRMAKVSLTFAEIVQVQGRIHVHDAADRRVFGRMGYRANDPALGSGRE